MVSIGLVDGGVLRVRLRDYSEQPHAAQQTTALHGERVGGVEVRLFECYRMRQI